MNHKITLFFVFIFLIAIEQRLSAANNLNPVGESFSTKKTQMVKESLLGISPFSPGSNNLALDLGQVFLMGNLSSNFADSIGFRVHYTYGVSDMFGFDTSIGYSEHSDGKYSLATLLAGMRTNLSWYDKIVPYLVFGLGFYKPSRLVSPSVTVSPVEFGVHLGPGVDLELTRQLYFGAALTFHNMFGALKQTPGGVVDFGGTFTSFLLHLGTTF